MPLNARTPGALAGAGLTHPSLMRTGVSAAAWATAIQAHMLASIAAFVPQSRIRIRVSPSGRDPQFAGAQRS